MAQIVMIYWQVSIVLQNGFINPVESGLCCRHLFLEGVYLITIVSLCRLLVVSIFLFLVPSHFFYYTRPSYLNIDFGGGKTDGTG